MTDIELATAFILSSPPGEIDVTKEGLSQEVIQAVEDGDSSTSLVYLTGITTMREAALEELGRRGFGDNSAAALAVDEAFNGLIGSRPKKIKSA
jgi:hypothetical protein